MKLRTLPSYLVPPGLPSKSGRGEQTLHRLSRNTGLVVKVLEEVKSDLKRLEKISKADQEAAAKSLSVDLSKVIIAADDLCNARPAEDFNPQETVSASTLRKQK